MLRWLRSVLVRALRRRIVIAGCVVFLLLWLNGVPPRYFTTLFAVPFAFLVMLAAGPPLLSLAVGLIVLLFLRVPLLNKIKFEQSEAESLLNWLGGMLTLVAVFFAVAVPFKFAGWFVQLPEATALLITNLGFDVDAELLFTLLPVLSMLVAACCVVVVATQAGRERPGSVLSLRHSVWGEKVDDERLHNIADRAREYAWALLLVFVALVPAVLRMSWQINVVAAIVLPLAVTVGRLDYARSLGRNSRSHARRAVPEAEVEPRYETRPVDSTTRAVVIITIGAVGLFALVGLLMALGGDSSKARLIGFSIVIGALTLVFVVWPWVRRTRQVAVRTRVSE